MLKKCYAVKDIRVSSYDHPFVETEEINAIRGFTVAVRNKGSQIGQFPQDFELHEVGEYDTNTGKTKANETSVLVITGATVVLLDESAERMKNNASL